MVAILGLITAMAAPYFIHARDEAAAVSVVTNVMQDMRQCELVYYMEGAAGSGAEMHNLLRASGLNPATHRDGTFSRTISCSYTGSTFNDFVEFCVFWPEGAPASAQATFLRARLVPGQAIQWEVWPNTPYSKAAIKFFEEKGFEYTKY